MFVGFIGNPLAAMVYTLVFFEYYRVYRYCR